MPPSFQLQVTEAKPGANSVAGGARRDLQPRNGGRLPPFHRPPVAMLHERARGFAPVTLGSFSSLNSERRRSRQAQHTLPSPLSRLFPSRKSRGAHQFRTPTVCHVLLHLIVLQMKPNGLDTGTSRGHTLVTQAHEMPSNSAGCRGLSRAPRPALRRVSRSLTRHRQRRKSGKTATLLVSLDFRPSDGHTSRVRIVGAHPTFPSLDGADFGARLWLDSTARHQCLLIFSES